MKAQPPALRPLALLLAASLSLEALSADPSALFTAAADAKRAKSAFAALKSAKASYLERLGISRKAFASGEAAELNAWAAARASSSLGSGGAEGAAPDGGYAGAEAAQAAFHKARDGALAAARDIEGRRPAAAGAGARPSACAAALAELSKRGLALAKLFASVPLSSSASAYSKAEAELLSLSPELGRLFPEALELGKLLKAGGKAGRRLWLSALAAGDAEESAAFLLSSRAAVLAAAPSASGPLARLEAALGAEAALSRVSLLFLCPSAKGDEEASFAAAARSLLSLGRERAAALLKALDGSAYRVLEGGAASARFSSLHARLGDSRRRALAASLGLLPGELALLADAAASAAGLSAPPAAPPFGYPSAAPARGKALEEELRALNGILAAAARLPAGSPRLAAYLPLLERPELMALAASEGRYAGLYREAGLSFSALFKAADAAAARELALSPALSKAASRLFPKSSASPRLEIIALELAAPGRSRGMAFVASASSPEGRRYLLPIPPSLAGPAYARALSAALGEGGAEAPAAPESSLFLCNVSLFGALPRGEERLLLPMEAYPAQKTGWTAGVEASLELELDLLSGGEA